MHLIIHWFRRDFRITDNTALIAAAKAAQEIVPVYILSEWKKKHSWTGAARQQFLCESLESLSKNLTAIGGRLIVRQGEAVSELLKLAQESGAQSIYTNRDPDPFGRAVEEQLITEAAKQGIEVHLFSDVSMHEPGEVLTQSGTPFRVFTPYARAWSQLSKASPSPALKKITTPVSLSSLRLPTLAHWDLKNKATIISGGEKAAQARLKKFVAEKIFDYSSQRDLMGEEGTSRLSQDLRFGLLSPRQVYAAVIKQREKASLTERRSLQVFINELIWREFAFELLWYFPEVLEVEFNPVWRGMNWPGLKKEPNALQRWKEGLTGFPIIDAAMRQLATTGWMHNRARMIVAMFLTKDLHIDWREGEQFFMQSLVDGEIASNNMGWQWSAGTGADAAPYFRIQNPWTQTKRYDPEGTYIKHWVPELQNVDPKLFFKAPTAGISLAKNYPEPMVDHAEERARTLELFAEYKSRNSD